jgi:hypothetical protein
MTEPQWVVYEEGASNAKGHWQQYAPREAVEFVLSSRIGNANASTGRSRWVWIRLPNGALVLATYPRGDTYFSTEQWRAI